MIKEQVRTTIIALRNQPLPHAEPANLYFQWCGIKEEYITIAIIDNQKKSWYFLQSLNHIFYSPDNKDHSSHQTWTTSLRLGWPSRWTPSPPGQQRSGIAGPGRQQSRLLRRSQSGRRRSPCSGLKGVFLLGMGNKQWGWRNGVRGNIIIKYYFSWWDINCAYCRDMKVGWRVSIAQWMCEFFTVLPEGIYGKKINTELSLNCDSQCCQYWSLWDWPIRNCKRCALMRAESGA